MEKKCGVSKFEDVENAKHSQGAADDLGREKKDYIKQHRTKKEKCGVSYFDDGGNTKPWDSMRLIQKKRIR